VIVPLVHHYLTADGREVGLPSGSPWWHALAGEVGRIGVGILVAELAY
jgi:hypothetical protein